MYMYTFNIYCIVSVQSNTFRLQTPLFENEFVNGLESPGGFEQNAFVRQQGQTGRATYFPFISSLSPL